jgi:anti-sigma regulatory factor (Ser/Thr protein kinase)
MDVAPQRGARAVTEQPNPVRWSVPAVLEQVGPLRRSVTAYAGELGLTEPRLGELALAVGEAIANVVIHAYRDAEPGAGTLDVTAEVRHGALVIAVLDRGSGLVPRPDSPGLGLGLSLIAQVCDSLRITGGSDHRGTEVHMTFLLSARAAAARADDPAGPSPTRLAQRSQM